MTSNVELCVCVNHREHRKMRRKFAGKTNDNINNVCSVEYTDHTKSYISRVEFQGQIVCFNIEKFENSIFDFHGIVLKSSMLIIMCAFTLGLGKHIGRLLCIVVLLIN